MAISPAQLLPALEVMRDYPHIFPPPGFRSFDRNGSGIIVADGPVTVAEVNVPAGMEGWGTQVGLESSDWSTVYFSMLMDGQPIEDYTRLTLPLGSPTTPKQVYIRLKANSNFKLNAVGYNSPVNVAIRWNFFGWYYPGMPGEGR